jgi:hypothetical protein
VVANPVLKVSIAPLTVATLLYQLVLEYETGRIVNISPYGEVCNRCVSRARINRTSSLVYDSLTKANLITEVGSAYHLGLHARYQTCDSEHAQK